MRKRELGITEPSSDGLLLREVRANRRRAPFRDAGSFSTSLSPTRAGRVCQSWPAPQPIASAGRMGQMKNEYFSPTTTCKSVIAAFALGLLLQACSVVGPPKPPPRPVPVPTPTPAEPVVRYEPTGWSPASGLDR